MRSRIFFIIFSIFGLAFVFASKSFAELYYDYQILKAMSYEPVSIGLTEIEFVRTIQQGVVLTAGDREFHVTAESAREWFETFSRSYTYQEEVRPKIDSINQFLISVAAQIEKSPENAHIGIGDNDTDVLIELSPSSNGIKLERDESIKRIIQSIRKGQSTIELATTIEEPEVSLAKLHKLGIWSRISTGESSFAGSPESRAHNIQIGARLFNSIIVGANEEFSFNKFLGPVGPEQGYEPELIIRGKKLVKDYGGGICQVSTTLFRAAIYAGFPIIERQSHSMPVRYYNPQGFDAAIYPGIVDLRFKNDSQSPIYIQSQIKGSKITFEIFGQKDNRKVTVNGPTTLNADPEGALKTLLTRVVKKGDEKPVAQSFYSHYKSPKSFEIVRNPLE